MESKYLRWFFFVAQMFVGKLVLQGILKVRLSHLSDQLGFFGDVCCRLGVSKYRGIPKWMVYNGKLLLKWMIWGYPYFWKHPYRLGCSPSQDAIVANESV